MSSTTGATSTKATSSRRAAEPLGPVSIVNLPRTVLSEIMLNLAHQDYQSLYSLAAVSVFFRDLCREFIKDYPESDFRPALRAGRPAGESESDEEAFDPWDDLNLDQRSDDAGDVLDYFDQLSFGSNYDEELHELYRAEHEDHNPDERAPARPELADAFDEEW